MTIAYRLDGALLPFQSVRLQGNDGVSNTFPSFALMGEPGIASIRIEDPSGTLDINGWHTFTVEETSCSKPRIFTGWVLGRRISRGPYRTGAGRIWDCEIIDQNALFSFEVFRSTSASVRGAETDVARVQACIASHAMGGTPIYDNGRLSTSGALSLGAANFVGQTPADMLSNTAGQCAKNFYAYWDDSARQISIHYDLVGAGPAAGISISNVLSDVTSPSGGTCYPPMIDAELEQDPSPEYTGVLLHWTGGYTYDRNDTLIDDLSPTEFSPTNFLRDLVIDSDRIGRATTAASQLAKQLDIHSVEAETLTCTIQVRAEHVNLCQAGDIISVRFSHIPGYTTATNVAIVRRNVAPVDEMDDLYNVTLEMSNHAVGGSSGGGTGGLPHGDSGDHWWSGAGGIENDILSVNVGGASPAFVEGTYNWSVTFDESGAPDPTYASQGWIHASPAGSYVGRKFNTDVTPAPGGDSTTFTGTFVIDSGGTITGDGKPTTNPSFTLGNSYYFNASTAGPHSPKPHKFTTVAFWFDLLGASEPIPPKTGQPVDNETPTPDPGSGNVTFTTTYPFTEGSLRVEVDGIDETDAVTGYDADAGSFSLSFDPRPSERVRVWYQAR